MDGEKSFEQIKRVAPLSTVSLDSSYNHESEEMESVEKKWLRSHYSFAPFIVSMGFVLVTILLVLALSHDDTIYNRGALNEEDPAFSTVFSSSTSNQRLTAPQKELSEWFKQAWNASQIDVEGDSSNMSFSGVLFPHNDSITSPQYDAFLTVHSGAVLPSRQYVAVENGRGFQWTTVSLSGGDSITTSGCLVASQILPFDGFDLVLKTANRTSSDDRSKINVVFNGTKYTISKVEDDFDYFMVDDSCYSIVSEDEGVNLSVCAPARGNLLLKSDFADVFQATNQCPQFTPKSINSKRVTMPFVPLPLQKWYASYPGRLNSS